MGPTTCRTRKRTAHDVPTASRGRFADSSDDADDGSEPNPGRFADGSDNADEAAETDDISLCSHSLFTVV